MDSNKGQLSSISSTSDLIDAKLEDQHRLYGSKHCPGCGHKLEGSKPDWLGLPAGVKFDPTDQELIEHLEAKVESGNSSKSHPLIDEFIPTLEGEDGICYTHPEKLPGVTRDGLSRHFFHRPSKAYTTGTRKRRKIQTECDLQGGETRWHKTGKTRPVMANGKQKGCKKILVLYTNFGKNRKPEKTNWVMHQYHLGQHEEEREGELVVSKIFYQTQPRQCNWLERSTTSSTMGPGEGSGEASGSGRRDGGGGGGSVSSKEVVVLTGHHRDDHLVVGGAAMGTTVVGYTPLEIHQQLKGDPFSYVPFRKGFDEAVIGGGDVDGRSGVGVGREGMTAVQAASMSAALAVCEDMHHQQQEHHPHQQMAFHVRRPTHPISVQMISPPPLHHASMMLDDHHHDSFHVPTIILPNHSFQQHQPQQQTEQQHHKIGGRSASDLEEIIMGCTSSSSTDIKEESSITNPPDAEWLIKYSTSFWPDPDNPDHHG